MTSVISQAFVVVKPDLANFATELRTQLKTAIGQIKVGERTILVRAQFEKGTRDKLIASLGTKPIPVFVEPVLAPNSLATLRAQIKSLGAVPVDVGPRRSVVAGTPFAAGTEFSPTAAQIASETKATAAVTSFAEANAAAAVAANEAAAAILREAAALEELQLRGAKVGPVKLASLKGQALAASNERLAAQQAAQAASQVAAATGQAEQQARVDAAGVALKERVAAANLAIAASQETAAKGQAQQEARVAAANLALKVNADTVTLIAEANAVAVAPVDALTLALARQTEAARALALARAEGATETSVAKLRTGLNTATANVVKEEKRIDDARLASRQAAATAEEAIAKEAADFRIAQAERVRIAEAAIAEASLARGAIAGAGSRALTPRAETGAQLRAAGVAITAADEAVAAATATTEARLIALAEAEKVATVAALGQAEAADIAAISNARQAASVDKLAQLERTLARVEGPAGNTRRERAAAASKAAATLNVQASAAALKFAGAESIADAATQKRILEIEKLSVALAASTKSEFASAAAAEKTAAAQARAAKTEATRSSQALRGVGATSASFLGLRGAVLSSSAPFLIATTAVIAFAKTIGTASSLQQNLNVFQSVAGATADQMARVSENAKALGADLALPATSANNAAEAMTELAKAGLSVNQTIDASRGVLQLATAANISVGDAATITASQLNAFGLAGSEASRVADLLAGASISAQGEITDFALAFQQVATVAKQVDLSINTTTAILTEFAKAGLRSSDAGTSLRTLLLRLVPTSKSAAEAQRLLGVQIDRNIPIGQQFFDLIDQFRLGLAKLDPIAQQETLTKIFGQDAIRGASIAFSEGSTSLRRLQDEVSQAGLAAQITEGRTKGLAGAIAGLKSQIETLAGTLGTSLLPVLESIAKTLSGIVGNANSAAQALQKISNVTIKPIGNLLGGTDALTGAALTVGLGLGIKALQKRRAASKAAALEEVAAQTQVVAAVDRVTAAIVGTSVAHGSAAAAAEKSAAVQVGASGAVTAAEARQLAATQRLIVAYEEQGIAAAKAGALAAAGAAKAAAANKALGIGIAASIAGSAAGGEVGGAISNVGNAVALGALTAGLPGAIVAAGVATGLEFIKVGQRDTAENKAKWDALSYEEQMTILRNIGGEKNGLIGPEAGRFLQTFGFKLKQPPSLGITTAAASFAIGQAIPTIDLRGVSQGRGGDLIGKPTLTGKIATNLFPQIDIFQEKKKAAIKGIAQEKVNKRLEAQLALAFAEAAGDSGAITTAIKQLIAEDTKQIAAIQKSLLAFVDLGGFTIKGEEARGKLKKQLIEVVNNRKGLNSQLEQLLAEAAKFEIPASVTVAGINAGTTKTLTDDLANQQTVAGLTAKALQNQLSKKKKDQDTIDDLSIKLAQANAAVTNTTQQIADQNVANAQSQLQIAADAAGNIGAAENKYIAFLRAQANDASKTTAEQIAAQKALTDEIDKRKNALQGIVDAAKGLRDARTDLLAQIAASTTGIKDDVRIKNLQIRQDRKDIKDIQDRIVAEKLKGEKLKDAQTQIVKIKSDIFAKQQEIKKLQEGDSGGFSLNDLFKEAISQFNQFGSNVASGTVSTGGSVRGALAGGILAQKNDLTKADRDKLQVAGTTNDLLSQILDAVRAAGLPDGTHTGRTFVGGIAHGQPTAKQARSFARLHAR